jgi:hypothetical protein
MAWSSKVHFNESTGFDVDSGGQVVFAEGGILSSPVLGTTAHDSTEVAAGTTFPNFGTVVLTQDSTSDPRLFTVKAPVKGCFLNIIVATSQTTGSQKQINLGTGVGVKYAGTTSMQYLAVSTDSVSSFTYKAISLVGLSTSLWGVVSAMPSTTAWTFTGATS